MVDKALIEMGWADESNRKELLLQFIDGTSMGWCYIMDSPGEDFDHKNASEFTEPTVTENNNQYTVEFWVRAEAGMLPQSEYYKIRLTFSNTAQLTNTETIDSFVMKYDGYDED